MRVTCYSYWYFHQHYIQYIQYTIYIYEGMQESPIFHQWVVVEFKIKYFFPAELFFKSLLKHFPNLFAYNFVIGQMA